MACILHKSYFMKYFKGCNVSEWRKGQMSFCVISRHENFQHFPLNFRGHPQMTSKYFGLKLTPKLSCHISSQLDLPYKKSLQNYYPLPKPKVNALSLGSSWYCLKPKHLPVRSILLLQNVIQNNARGLGLLQTDAT
jgi:hypothetical protein